MSSDNTTDNHVRMPKLNVFCKIFKTLKFVTPVLFPVCVFCNLPI